MESESELTSTRAVEECLKKNKEMELILTKAMLTVQERVDFIRNRMAEIKEVISSSRGEIETKFQFLSDWSESNGCPPNADTIARRKQTGGISWWEYCARNFRKCRTGIWTGVQNRALNSTIYNLEVEERIKEHIEKISDLSRMIEKKMDLEKIASLKKEIADFDPTAVRKKSLQELVSTGKGIYDWNKVSQLLQKMHTPIECQARWNQYLHPAINKSPWNQDEDISLLMIAERRKEQDWESISAELGTGRSAYTCFTTYQNRLRGRQISTSTPEPAWTVQDDAKLSEAVLNSRGPNGVRWDLVAESNPNRTKKQLFARWTQVLDPRLKRGTLSRVEQRAIVIGVQRFGLDFPKIQNCLLRHRTVSQIRHFTLYRINRVTGRGRWLQFTEQVFKAIVEFLGAERWLEVRSYFPYNTVRQLKRRYERVSKRPENIILFASTRKKLKTFESHKTAGTQLPEMDVDNSESGHLVSASIAVQPGSSKQKVDEFVGEEGGQSSASLPTSENHAQSTVQGKNASEPNEPNEETDCSDAELQGCKRRRGRPPSRKKRMERTKPKRAYVRTGQFKIAVEESPVAKRELRSNAARGKSRRLSFNDEWVA